MDTKESRTNSEIKEPTLDIFLDSVLATQEDFQLISAKYTEMIDAARSTLHHIDPESVGPDQRAKLLKVRQLWEGNGGA